MAGQRRRRRFYNASLPLAYGGNRTPGCPPLRAASVCLDHSDTAGTIIGFLAHGTTAASTHISLLKQLSSRRPELNSSAPSVQKKQLYLLKF